MNLSRNIGLNTVVRISTSIGEKLLVFGFMAVFARRLGSEQLGVYTFALSWTVFFRLLTDWGLNAITIRRLSTAPAEVRPALFGAILSLRLLLTTAAGLISVLALALTRMPVLTKVAVAIAALTLADVISDTFGLVLQAELRQTWQGIAEFCTRALWSILAIAAVLRGGDVLLLLGILGLSSLVQAGVLACCAYRLLQYRPNIRVDLWKEVLEESWPLALQALMSTIYLRMDHLLLFQMSGAAALGYYAAATKLAEPWGLGAGVFISAIYPLLCRFYGPDRLRFEKLARYAHRYLFAAIFALVAIATLYSPEILRLVFGADFVKSSNAFVLLMWAEIFLFANMSSHAVLVAAGLQRITLFLTLAAAVANIVLNLLLIPRFGIAGAAWASFFSYPMYCITQTLVRRTRPFAWLIWKAMWRPFVAAAAVCAIFRFAVAVSFLVGIFAVPALYLVVLTLLGGLNFNDLAVLRASIRPEAANVTDQAAAEPAVQTGTQ